MILLPQKEMVSDLFPWFGKPLGDGFLATSRNKDETGGQLWLPLRSRKRVNLRLEMVRMVRLIW